MTGLVVARTDRIGDLVLALPVAEAAKKARPGLTVTYLVSPRTSELAGACPFVDRTIEYDESWKSPGHVLALAGELKAAGADSLLFLRPTLATSLAGFLARLPVRVGTAYRYYSPLFNRKIREHRRFAEKHESEYNLSALQSLLEIEDVRYVPCIRLDEASRDEASGLLRGLGLRTGGFVVVHPGSGGSARNLPLPAYARIADLVETRFGLRVLVTGGPPERGLIRELARLRTRPTLDYTGAPSLLALAALLAQARLFISGSTGPMHLAAAVETPTLSFFSPVRSCSPKRWRPLGSTAVVLVPPVPQCPTCLGRGCEHFDCMDLITMETVESRLETLLRQRRP
jgi:ADP-heptose:LPS heptosyltransferase